MQEVVIEQELQRRTCLTHRTSLQGRVNKGGNATKFKHMKNKIYLFLFTCALLAGCSEEVMETHLRGSVVGFVKLVNDQGNVLQNGEEVEVFFKNTDFTGTTNENGRFELTGIQPGTYNLELTKEGYGAHHYYGLPVVGGNEALVLRQPITLYQQPTVELEFVSVDSDDETIKVNLDLTGSVNHVFSLYLADHPQVSPMDYSYRVSSQYSGYYGDKLFLSVYHSELEKKLINAESIYMLLTVRNRAEEYMTYNPEINQSSYTSEKQLGSVIRVR